MTNTTCNRVAWDKLIRAIRECEERAWGGGPLANLTRKDLERDPRQCGRFDAFQQAREMAENTLFADVWCECEACEPVEDQPEDSPTAEDERGWDAREDGEPAPILPSLVSAPETRLNRKVSL